MILFHGTNENFPQIDLSKCKPYKAFGLGFYLTTIPEQAQQMALKTARMYGGGPCVLKYSIDDSIFSSSNLCIKSFPQEDNNSDNLQTD